MPVRRSRSGAPGRRGKGGRLAVLLAAALALSALLVATTITIPSTDPAGDAAAVELPTATEVPATERTRATQPPTAGPTCRPHPCADWTAAGPYGAGPIALHPDLIVHVGPDVMTAIDPDNGLRRWLQRRPGTAAVADVHLDRRQLVVTGGSSVWIHEAPTGDLVHAVDLGDVEARTLDRLGTELVVVGDATGRPGEVVTVLGDDGAIRWQRTVASVWHETWRWHDGDPLLVLDDGALIRLGRVDGRELWRVPLAGRSVHLDRPILLTDGEAGTVDVVDPLNGGTAATLHIAGATGAWRIGPWIAVTTADELHVHHPSDGRRLFGRPEPVDAAASLWLDDRVVIAWPPREGTIEVATHRLDGSHAYSVEVPLPASASDDCCVYLKRTDVATVRVGTGDGRAEVEVDLARRRVLERRLLAAGPRQQAWRVRDVVIVATAADRLRIHGPDGMVAVTDAAEVVSTDPVLVRGVGGLLAVDTAALRASPLDDLRLPPVG